MQVAPTTEELLEIHGRIRACVACRLHVTRTQAVPGYGPVEARIMAVGEAPGEKEDQQGRPFVGAAGKLLTELVESIGLTRRDIYITNTVRCRPPGNRDPEPDEVQACSHFLDEQIALMRPDVILILGRHALHAPAAGVGGDHPAARPARGPRRPRLRAAVPPRRRAVQRLAARDALRRHAARAHLPRRGGRDARGSASSPRRSTRSASTQPIDQLSLFAL